MPRLDNGDLDVLVYFNGRIKGQALYELAQRDPGAVNPIDVCASCDENEVLNLPGDVSHPPYEEQNPRYECAICSSYLFEEDNGLF